jgi:hypothetical protein
MRLNKLILKDKKLFDRYLSLSRHELSVYSFENIYIWRGLFDISWAVIENSLCVFFKDNIGCFLYLAPLGNNKNSLVIKKAFETLDTFNKNKDISRIENIEAEDVAFYQGLGFSCREKSQDYLCKREELANLRGDKFKSKRACLNYFVKNYHHEYLSYSAKDKDGCLKLYRLWKKQRQEKNKDPIFLGMLEDSLNCFKILLRDYRSLGVTGRIVKIDKEIKAFTFGFKLNQDTFCILYEISDLSVKGLAQFIFQRFCAELKDFKFINIMDDSGLENLQKVKLSYHPAKLVPAYIAKRDTLFTNRQPACRQAGVFPK